MPGLIMAVGTPWKRALYLGFLFLLATLKERIVADPPSSPTSVLQVEEGGAADTEKQSYPIALIIHSLYKHVSGQTWKQGHY